MGRTVGWTWKWISILHPLRSATETERLSGGVLKRLASAWVRAGFSEEDDGVAKKAVLATMLLCVGRGRYGGRSAIDWAFLLSSSGVSSGSVLSWGVLFDLANLGEDLVGVLLIPLSLLIRGRRGVGGDGILATLMFGSNVALDGGFVANICCDDRVRIRSS